MSGEGLGVEGAARLGVDDGGDLVRVNEEAVVLYEVRLRPLLVTVRVRVRVRVRVWVWVRVRVKS